MRRPAPHGGGGIARFAARTALAAVLGAFACLSRADDAFSGYEWTNVTPENRIGGRMVSPGYLRGKTVLIDSRDYGSKSCVEDVKALQQIWNTYKTKEFIVIGCHTGAADSGRVSKIIDRLGVTYPVYNGAGVAGREGDRMNLPALAVLDSTGTRFVHKGTDVRKVSGVVGSLIFLTKRPTGAQTWKKLLDWEIENMPGHAFNRLRDLMADSAESSSLRAKFPADMKRYEETYAKWKESNEIKKTAKLVGLAVAVKDRDVNSNEAKKITKSVIEGAIGKYSKLKESSDPRIVQEAKNAIADLMFAEATLKK